MVGGGESNFPFVLTSQTSAWDKWVQPCLAAPPSPGLPQVSAIFYFIILAKEASDTVGGNESAPVMY